MLFRDLANYLKKHMGSKQSLKPLLAQWLYRKHNYAPAEDLVGRVIRAEFHVLDFVNKGQFLIVPKSLRASNLLTLLREYVAVMDDTRLERLRKGATERSPRRRQVRSA